MPSDGLSIADTFIAILLALFGVKIAWNFLVPYRLAHEAWAGRNSDAKRTRAASLVPFEIVPCILIFLVAFIWRDSVTFLNWKQAALGGATVILASYIHLFLVGNVAGWLIFRLGRKRNMHE